MYFYDIYFNCTRVYSVCTYTGQWLKIQKYAIVMSKQI